MRALEPVAIVRGNHDKVACGLEQAEGFNAVAKSAAHWTLDSADAGASRLARRAAAGAASTSTTSIEICHGSPFDEDAYIFDELDARARAESVDAAALPVRPHALSGHLRAVAARRSTASGAATRRRDAAAADAPASKYLVNPGSVGQPRDGDPRAAYAIVDTDARRVELFRLTYPVEETQAKIIKAGLPEVLAQRLAVGR